MWWIRKNIIIPVLGCLYVVSYSQPVDVEFYNQVKSDIDVVALPVPDVEKLLIEDNNNTGLFYRTGVAIQADLNPKNCGTWFTYRHKKNVWLLKVISNNAKGLALDFDKFDIPVDAKLYIYNEERSFLYGPYTYKDKLLNGCFASDIISGDHFTIEYSLPAQSSLKGVLNIADISYIYTGNSIKSFGESGDCQVNINCPEGDNWQDEKRGVAKIFLKVGTDYGYCTGTLLNNTSENCEQYFITADHCGNGASESDLNFWRFYFNYESSLCTNSVIEPGYNMTYGCEYVASSGDYGQNGSDFYLIKLNNPNFPDPTWNLYYNGWNNENISSTGGVCIHHPKADIKKISVYYTQPQSSSVGSVPGTHWRIIWSETITNHGVTEPGSSGSPLFDNNGYVIGTLTGGLSECSTPYSPDYFGKISYSWNSNGQTSTEQIEPWLDPLNTGQTKLSGINFSDCNNNVMRFQQYINIETFPNPVNDKLFVKLNNIDTESVLSYLIINQYGKIILSKKCLHIQNDLLNIETKNISSGVYILKLIINNKYYLKRFVVINISK